MSLQHAKTLGNASTALQGAVIGHFLNEIQEVPGYSTASGTTREGTFATAHAPSLTTEGKIYGELVGDTSITTRADATTGIANGFQTVIYNFNSTNKYEMQQGVKQNGTEIVPLGNGVNYTAPKYESTGELKSVKKLP